MTALVGAVEEFHGEEDSRLGLVGAFGYDLLFQFEPIEKKLPRDGRKLLFASITRACINHATRTRPLLSLDDAGGDGLHETLADRSAAPPEQCRGTEPRRPAAALRREQTERLGMSPVVRLRTATGWRRAQGPAARASGRWIARSRVSPS